MPAGKHTSLWSIEVGEHKRDLILELRPERVDDALQLGAVRSAR
jgi:hypothetical protein